MTRAKTLAISTEYSHVAVAMHHQFEMWAESRRSGDAMMLVPPTEVEHVQQMLRSKHHPFTTIDSNVSW